MTKSAVDYTRDPAAFAGNGPVMAIGGAEDKLKEKAILTAFWQLAGGRKAKIVVIPTASSLEDAGERYKAIFLAMGAKKVDVIFLNERADANLASAVAPIKGATGIFMTGGNQMRLAAVVAGTKVQQAVLDRHAAGAVVAGTSAGASVLSAHMVAHGSSGPVPKLRMAQLAAGFGLLPGLIIDQHFRERDRFGRLMTLVATSPSLLGVGVDEDTCALVWPDGVMEVLGRHSVTIVDGSNITSDVHRVKGHSEIAISNAIVHIVTPGRKFDTRKRVMIWPSPKSLAPAP